MGALSHQRAITIEFSPAKRFEIVSLILLKNQIAKIEIVKDAK